MRLTAAADRPPADLPALGSGRLPLPGADTPRAVRRDYTAFLVDRELHYTRSMTAFLRDELGVRAMLVDTQVD